MASALTVRRSSAESARNNESAESLGTLCVGNGSEVHIVKSLTGEGGICEM
jgi:hypothetical protein